MRMRLPAVILLAGAAAGVLVFSLASSRPEPSPRAPDDLSSQDRPAAAPAENDEPVDGEDPPEETGAIQGRILVNGQPTAAVVELWRVYASEFTNPLDFRELADDPGAFARTESAEDGTFEFKDVPFRMFEVRAISRDDLKRSVYGGPDPWIPIFQAEIELVVEPRPTHELRGVAVWSDGTPFRGHVSCYRDNDPYNPPVPFEKKARVTDEAGRFVLPDLMPGEVILQTREAGRFLATGPRVTVPYAGEYRHVVDAGFPYVAGRVVDATDDSAVAGARVDGMAWRDPETTEGPCFFRVTTDRNGGFRVPWFEQPVEITVRVDSYVPFEQQFYEKPEPLVLRLGRPLTVSGRVLSRAGPPVPGVPVTWTPNGASVPQDVSGGKAKSDEDGSFQLTGVPPGPILIYALGNGWVQKELVDLARQEGFQGDPFDRLTRVLAATGAEPEQIEVVRSATVRGRVMAVDGAPAPGVPVSAWPEINLGRLPRSLFWPETVTDDSGEFEVTGLLPGLRYHFEARPADGALTPAKPFAAEPGETVELEIRLVPGRWLDVTVVVEGTDDPIEGAEVILELRGDDIPAGGGPFTSGRPLPGAWNTGADGLVHIGPLPPGLLGLRVRAEGYRVPRLWSGFEVAESESKFRIELTHDLSLSGNVLLPDGSPAAGGWLEITGPPSWEMTGWKSRLGTDGTFTLSNLPPGSFTLKATCESDGRVFSGILKLEAGTRDAVLRLMEGDDTPENAIVVRLSDRKGNLVFRARAIVIIGRSAEYAEVSRGRLAIPLEGVSDPVRIEIYQPSSDVGPSALPLGAVYAGPLDPKPCILDLAMPPESIIAGRVVDEHGKGVAGTQVRARVRRDAEWGPGTIHADATTDFSGAFRLGRLAEESYRIEFTTSGEFAPPKSVDVRAGSEPMRVVATRGITVVITVVTESNRPVPNAVVSVDDGDRFAYLSPPVRKGVTDAKGEVRLSGLDPLATYRLVVHIETKPNYFEHAAEESKWSPRDTRIRIRPR